jgi:hypothetical protein
MPPLETMDRHQWMVYWEYIGQDTYGLPTVSEPVELLVRWIDKIAQVVDPTGNTVQSSAQVVTDRTLPIQSIVWQGRLKDLEPPYNDLHIVIGNNSTPDIKARNTRFEFALMRYTSTLPTIVDT